MLLIWLERVEFFRGEHAQGAELLVRFKIGGEFRIAQCGDDLSPTVRAGEGAIQ